MKGCCLTGIWFGIGEVAPSQGLVPDFVLNPFAFLFVHGSYTDVAVTSWAAQK